MNKKYKVLALSTLASLCTLSINAHAETSQETCSAIVNDAHNLNAYQLFEGLKPCDDAGLDTEMNFLLIAGQIRAMTDMANFTPISKEDKSRIGKLYYTLFYQLGGSGHDNVYRDPKKHAEFLKKIEKFNAHVPPKYSPSWNYRTDDFDKNYYQKVLTCQKAIRLSKLTWYSQLIQNDEYQQLSQQMNQLKKDSGGIFKEGTDNYKKHLELMKQQNAIMETVPMFDKNPKECDFPPKPFKADPNASFKQIYTGYNGLKKDGMQVFNSMKDVNKSWLAQSIPEEKRNSLLADIDFDKNILISYNFGKATNATDKVYITDLEVHATDKPNITDEEISIHVSLGMKPPRCQSEKIITYPFTLVVAERPSTEAVASASVSGYSRGNFPDSCDAKTPHQ